MNKSNILPIKIKSTNNSSRNINQQNQSPSNHNSSTITSLVSASNIDHDNHSLSIATSSQDQSHQNQIVEYSTNQSFQDLLEQAKNVYKNQITESTRLQYLSANTGFVIFYFAIIAAIFFNHILINTKNGLKMKHQTTLPKTSKIPYK